jgi:hypothetical protein
MKPLPILLILTAALAVSCSSGTGKQEKKDEEAKITFMERTADQAIDVMVDGKLFTSYRWPDNVWKPVLYPVFTSAGTEITRGFPLNPRVGERNDHPHQIGMWLTYWHARGYGLFSANPLGVKDFTNGKEELNFSVPAGKSVTFRYRVIVGSGSHLTDTEINGFADDFANRYH